MNKVQTSTIVDFEKEVEKINKVIKNYIRMGDSNVRSKLTAQYFARGSIYEKLNQDDKAIVDYSECIRIDNSYAEAYFRKSQIYQIRGDSSSALKELDRAINIDATNLTYHSHRAVILRRLGEYYSAIEDTALCKAVHFLPSLADQFRKGKLSASNTDFVSLCESIPPTKLTSNSPLEAIYSAASTPPQNRTESQLRAIGNYLTSLHLFKHLSVRIDSTNSFENNGTVLDELNLVCLSVEAITVPRGQYVFSEGSIGDLFYVILDGEIAIVPKGTVSTTVNPNNTSTTCSNGMSSVPASSASVIRKNETVNNSFVRLFQGQSFGDGNGVRMAGAVAAHDTRLLTLCRDIYLRVTAAGRETQKEEVYDMLRGSALFAGWPEDTLLALAAGAQRRVYSAGKVVMPAGSLCRQMFLVRHGLVQLIKTFSRPRGGQKCLSRKLSHSPKSEDNCSHPSLSSSITKPSVLNEYNYTYSGKERCGEMLYDSNISNGCEDKKNCGDDSTVDSSRATRAWMMRQTSSRIRKNGSALPTEDYIEGSVGGTDDTVSVTVRVLGSGQVFGEQAVLEIGSQQTVSPLSAVACCALELFAFDVTLLSHLNVRYTTACIQPLEEQFGRHNPPVERLVQLFTQREKWERRKAKLLRDVRRMESHP